MSLIRSVVLIIFCVASLCAFGAGAGAARLLTGGAFLGLNLTPASPSYSARNDGAPAFAGSLGFRLTPQWRVDGELSYAASGLAGAERRSRIALMNLYYDIDTGNRRLKPFLSIGAGLASHDVYRGGIDGLGIATETMNGMAWQAGAGLSYQFNDNLSLSGGYRHVGGAALDGNGYDIDTGGHEIRLGVKYQFPVPKGPKAELP